MAFDFFKAQWQDVKGNAKWDFFKGGLVLVIVALSKAWTWYQTAPWSQVLPVLIVVSAILVLMYRFTMTSIKFWRRKDGDRIAMAKQREWEKTRR
jgi:uncharacterized membrane protein